MTSSHPMQLTFDELRRSRRRDPETSKISAQHSHGLAAEHRLVIVHAMRDGGSRDWTAHEVAAACGLSSVQVSRRLAELRQDGEILETGMTRPTPSGRPAQCWRIAR
jgi:predicted ArsR family transcriptional regulator